MRSPVPSRRRAPSPKRKLFMNAGSLISTSSVVARSGGLGASPSALPRTRPSYPSRTIHVSHPLYCSHTSHISLFITHDGGKGGDALENACFDDRAHDGVHAGAVAARGENCEFHCEVLWSVPLHRTVPDYILSEEGGRWGRKLWYRNGKRLDKIQGPKEAENRVSAPPRSSTLGEHPSRRGPDATSFALAPNLD